ncbi:MAG: alanine racemase [Usitatibacter sp.]
MSRPILATISPAALRHNYGVAKRAAARSKVFAVVKANGYGHGRERVARLLGAGTDGFAMVELEGAIATRESGYRGPILLLEGFFEAAELGDIARSDLAAVVHEEEQIRMLEIARLERPIDIFFKVNTGMNRLGFMPNAVRPQLERMQRSKAARSITLMTHFATSEKPDGIEEAMRRFDEATRGIELPRSLSNTAAIFSHPRSHTDVARLGIGLYGATPFPDRSAESLGLKPAMTLTSRLIATQELRPTEAIGYGATFRVDRAMRIGVVACGYADGYPRHAPSGTPILVGGVRAKTAGRVSMDMITVDLAGIPDARVGTPVTLWGEGLPIDDVATPAGTVGYELMCALGERVPVVEAQD